MPGWIGRRDREAVAIGGSVVLPGGRALPVTIRDLTPEGCRIECDETLPIAATVLVDLGGSTAQAHVRWALGREAGLKLVNLGWPIKAGRRKASINLPNRIGSVS